jgi:hypothetical protein
MKPSHRDRLIAALPADLQAGLLDVLKSYSPDGNDMVEAIFAAVVETEKRNSSGIEAKLAASETREKQLAEQLAKTHAENIKTIRQEIGAINLPQYWKKLITSKFVGGIILAVCWVASTVAIQLFLHEREIAPMREVIAQHRQIVETLSDDPESLVASAKYSKEANSEALLTALSIHAISKLLTLPKMQMYRGDDGYLIIYGPKSSMPIGSTEDGRNWVKLANPVARVSPDTTPSINKAQEAEKKLNQYK